TDLTSCKIKYEEGFANIFGRFYTKPEMMWTQADQDLIKPTNYSVCVGFSLQTGTLLLLQCFWNFLANSVAKTSFMGSREFLFYIIWSCVSMVMFPVLQYNFSRPVYDPTYKEIMPELMFGIELFFVALLGLVSHVRFKKLLNFSKTSNHARSIGHKIQYFQELNIVLTMVLFVDALSFIILSADGLTGKKYLNVHKFTADFMICNINVSSLIVWFIVVLIFHPKPLTHRLGTSILPPPSQGVLSSAQPLDGLSGSLLGTQASQASHAPHASRVGSIQYADSVLTGSRIQTEYFSSDTAFRPASVIHHSPPYEEQVEPPPPSYMALPIEQEHPMPPKPQHSYYPPF
ncbi:hypothetical protein BX666DRAFT_1864250, partial [Dichotomocladium elegans]